MTTIRRVLGKVPNEVWWLAVALVLAMGFRTAFPRRHYDEVYTGNQPLEVASGADGVWVLNHGEHSVSLIDPGSQEIRFTTTVDDDAAPALAAGATGAWVLLDGGETLARVDAEAEEVVDRTDLVPLLDGPAQNVVAGPGSVWVTSGAAGRMARFDPATGERLVDIDVGVDVARPQIVGDALWVLRPDGLAEHNTATGEERRVVPLGHVVRDVVVGDGEAYLLTQVDPEARTGVVVAVDLDRPDRERTVTVTDVAPSRLALGDGRLFLSGDGGMLLAVDVDAMTVVGAEQVTRDTKVLRGLRVVDGQVWVADGADGVAYQPVAELEGERAAA